MPPSPPAAELPLDVLFPEDYAASKRMIVHDFAFLGALLVLVAVGAATWLSVLA